MKPMVDGYFYCSSRMIPGGVVYETSRCTRFSFSYLSLSQLKFYTKQLLLTLRHTHACGRQHLDIHQKNMCLLDTNELRIFDWGNSLKGMNTANAHQFGFALGFGSVKHKPRFHGSFSPIKFACLVA
eukprot:1151618-Pelagomonas_calceolata.AAC.4